MAEQVNADVEISDLTFGRTAVQVTPDNTTDLVVEAKCLEVVDITGGNILVYWPAEPADSGAPITVTGVYVGYKTSVRVRRVSETTSATVIAIN